MKQASITAFVRLINVIYKCCKLWGFTLYLLIQMMQITNYVFKLQTLKNNSCKPGSDWLSNVLLVAFGSRGILVDSAGALLTNMLVIAWVVLLPSTVRSFRFQLSATATTSLPLWSIGSILSGTIPPESVILCDAMFCRAADVKNNRKSGYEME